MVSCRAGGDGLDDDWIEVLPPLCVLLEDLVGGGGGSQPSLRPPLKLNPLRLLGNGGRPCREDMAILSCMLKKKTRISFNQRKEKNRMEHQRRYTPLSIRTVYLKRSFVTRNRESLLDETRDRDSINDLLAVAKRSFDCTDLDTVFGCSFERHCFARTATK